MAPFNYFEIIYINCSRLLYYNNLLLFGNLIKNTNYLKKHKYICLSEYTKEIGNLIKLINAITNCEIDTILVKNGKENRFLFHFSNLKASSATTMASATTTAMRSSRAR